MDKKETIKSITFILSGALMQMFNGIGGGWASNLVAIFGLVLFFMGLKKLKDGVDEAGQKGVQMLILAAIISIVGAVIDLIPLVGIVASIIYLVAFIIELLGYLKLKASASIGEVGKSGISLILVAMILGILSALVGIIPFAGAIVGSVVSLAAIILVFFGWLKIQEGLIEKL